MRGLKFRGRDDARHLGMQPVDDLLAGVPARANSMCQDTASKSAMPAASANDGTSGKVPSRVVEVTASARSLPSRISASDAADFGEGELHVAGGDVLDRLRADLVGHVRHLHAEALVDILAGKMRRAADRRRAECDLARPRLA